MERSKIILIAGVVILAGIYLAARQAEEPKPPPGAQATPSPGPSAESTVAAGKPGSTTQDVTELKIQDIKIGTGAEAKSGDDVTVDYRGTLTNGQQFDASYDRGQPFKFRLGAGAVIRGWDQGVAGMKVGGKRKLTVPPSLGYGAASAPGGKIPPNSTLIFEVELKKVG